LKTIERDVVAALGPAIARRIGEPRYKLWFERNTRFVRHDDHLSVGVPNRHFQEWLQKTFGTAVAAAAEEVFGCPLEVRFTIDPQLFQTARQEQAEVEAARQAAPAPTPAGGHSTEPRGRSRNREGAGDTEPRGRSRNRQGAGGAESGRTRSRTVAAPSGSTAPTASGQPARSEQPAPVRRTRRWRRLADFVVGPCNRVAHASATSVIEMPGECANPLVFHGPVGTGKTHLLEGIYAGLRRAHPDWRVTYITAEDFTNRFVQAVRLGRLNTFRKQFRECDVLLLDDLHFLARKKATQEEFLHTFDSLLADGRQMVLTCDCHPRLADDFSPELTDRLLGGAVWSLGPPDGETRRAILEALSAGREGPIFPREVLDFLASQLRGNVRELEGAVQSIRHFSRVTSRPIDVPLVREALAELLRHAVRVVQLADVDRSVCALLRLEAGTLQGKGRAWAISHPRMVAMFLARKHTPAAYSEIGMYFGGRNHSTVVAAEKKVRQWLQDDHELALGERRVRVRELVERVERDLFR
jgi:chromosomal replication initiator protein